MSVENNFKQTEVGSIPEDWEVVRLGEILKEVDIRVKNFENKGDLDVFSLTKEFGLIPQFNRFKKRIAVEDISNYKIVKKWWIVYNPYVIWEGAIHALRRHEVAAVSPVYVTWECENADPSFIDRLLRTSKLLNGYQALASGVVNRRRTVSKEDFLNIKIPLPPLEEQRKIAKVLDKIQQAIEVQDKIIEQAKNLKKSIMQKLFTEGLYGEEQKETEIGLIPKSWEVVRLGDVIEFSQKPRNLSILNNNEIPFIPMELIPDEGKYAKFTIKRYSEISSGTFVFKDDIILAKITPSFENGKQAILTNLPYTFGFATTEVIAFHPRNENMDSGYVFEFLRLPKIRRHLAFKMEGTTGRKRLSRSALENLLIPLPPLEEQKQIAHILSTIDKKIEIEQKRKEVLKKLFKTMLKLISGEIRLKEVEI